MTAAVSAFSIQHRDRHDDPLIDAALAAIYERGYSWQHGGVDVLPPADRVVCRAINAPLESLRNLLIEERKHQANLDNIRTQISDARQELEAIMALVKPD